MLFRSNSCIWMKRSAALLTALDILRRSYASEAAAAKRQRQRILQFLQLAGERSRFYQNLYARLPNKIADLAELPFVTKPDLMKHFDEVVTDPAVKRLEVEAFLADPTNIGKPYLGRYFVCTTSGTSGHPGIFVHDEFAWLVYELIAAFRGTPTLLGSNPRGLLMRSPRVLLLAAGGGHFAAASGFAWRRRTHPRLAGFQRMLSVLDPLPDQVKALNEFRPSIVVGYPSAITLLTEEQYAARLRIDPALIIVSGEWLGPAARKRIEQVFGCPVRNFYGASECMAVAYECSCGWLHVNNDWVILEPVDRNYRLVPAGTPSHTVLLTNLANNVQPLIRYDLGDSVVLKPDPCRCGRLFPSIRVEGRKSDVLTLPSATGGLIKILPLALATIVEGTSGLSRFQISQTGERSIEFRLDVKAEAVAEQVWQSLADTVRSYLTRQGVGAVELRFSPEPPRPSPVTGKFQQIQGLASVER